MLSTLLCLLPHLLVSIGDIGETSVLSLNQEIFEVSSGERPMNYNSSTNGFLSIRDKIIS